MLGIQTAVPAFIFPDPAQTGSDAELEKLVPASSLSASLCVLLPIIFLMQGSYNTKVIYNAFSPDLVAVVL